MDRNVVSQKKLHAGERRTVKVPLLETALELDGIQKHIRCSTPRAAELIVMIAESDEFVATPEEKRRIATLGRKIAGRYSGHPQI